MLYALLFAVGCGNDGGGTYDDYEATEECEIGESEAGDTLVCGENILYICALSDGSECWYEVDGARYYADGACDDPRSWEDAAQQVAEDC